MNALSQIFLKENEERTYSMNDFTNDIRHRLGIGGSFVSEEGAMQLTAVMSCVRILAETLAGTRLHLYRMKSDGSKERAFDHPLYDVLNIAPNSEMSAFQFLEIEMLNLCLNGNSFALKTLNGRGEIVELTYIPSKNVSVRRDPSDNQLKYKVVDSKGESHELTRNYVFHLPGLGFDGIQGFSPIRMAMKAISLGLAAEEFGDNFFKNGANMGSVLQYPSVMSDEAYQRLKSDFATQYAGIGNSHKAIILEEGATFTRLGIPPNEAQFLETRKFQIEEIARLYRVPLHLLQQLDRSTNNNIEHQSLEFVQYTMLPWFERWEQAINLQLLTKEDRQKGYFAEFNMLSLLRGDNKSRAVALQMQRQNGIISTNDWRRMENMNPIDSEFADALYINGAMMRMDQKNKGGEDDDKISNE